MARLQMSRQKMATLMSPRIVIPLTTLRTPTILSVRKNEPESDSDEDDDELIGTANREGGEFDGRNELVSETMDSFEDHLKDLVDTETEYTYGRIPKVELDKVVIPMSKWNEMIDTYDNDLGNDMAMAIGERKLSEVSFRE